MKENAVKLLVTHNALKSVTVLRSDKGARGASDEIGWVVFINGEALCSARRPERIFASLDTVAHTLLELGIDSYQVFNHDVSKSTLLPARTSAEQSLSDRVSPAHEVQDGIHSTPTTLAG